MSFRSTERQTPNTLYMQEALSHLRSAGEIPEDEHISRLSPLMYGHINMLGHYTFTLPENILKGELGNGANLLI